MASARAAPASHAPEGRSYPACSPGSTSLLNKCPKHPSHPLCWKPHSHPGLPVITCPRCQSSKTNPVSHLPLLSPQAPPSPALQCLSPGRLQQPGTELTCQQWKCSMHTFPPAPEPTSVWGSQPHLTPIALPSSCNTHVSRVLKTRNDVSLPTSQPISKHPPVTHAPAKELPKLTLLRAFAHAVSSARNAPSQLTA